MHAGGNRFGAELLATNKLHRVVARSCIARKSKRFLVAALKEQRELVPSIQAFRRLHIFREDVRLGVGDFSTGVAEVGTERHSRLVGGIYPTRMHKKIVDQHTLARFHFDILCTFFGAKLCQHGFGERVPSARKNAEFVCPRENLQDTSGVHIAPLQLLSVQPSPHKIIASYQHRNIAQTCTQPFWRVASSMAVHTNTRGSRSRPHQSPPS